MKFSRRTRYFKEGPRPAGLPLEFIEQTQIHIDSRLSHLGFRVHRRWMMSLHNLTVFYFFNADADAEMVGL